MSSICPCCNGIVPYGKEIEMPNVGTVGHIDHGKTYTEAELQEKLRQQREACLEAYSAKCLELFDRLPADNDYLSKGILNATIDNNGEEW